MLIPVSPSGRWRYDPHLSSRTAAYPSVGPTAELNIPYYPFLRRSVDCVIALDASADSQVSRPIVHEALDLADRRHRTSGSPEQKVNARSQHASVKHLTVCRTRGQTWLEDMATRRYLADSCSSWGRGCRGSLACPRVRSVDARYSQPEACANAGVSSCEADRQGRLC